MQSDYVIISCPHCEVPIMVLKKEFNCKIFRHGVYKKTYEQIDPHLPKVECDRLKANDLIIGCGKPFMLVDTTTGTKAVKCDYV